MDLYKSHIPLVNTGQSNYLNYEMTQYITDYIPPRKIEFIKSPYFVSTILLFRKKCSTLFPANIKFPQIESNLGSVESSRFILPFICYRHCPKLFCSQGITTNVNTQTSFLHISSQISFPPT
jgi:hypothetical protein